MAEAFRASASPLAVICSSDDVYRERALAAAACIATVGVSSEAKAAIAVAMCLGILAPAG